jgi:hypothetical protein
MAFTTAQATQIRKYLGFPQLNLFRNTRLEDAILIVGADVDASAEVVSILASLVTVEVGLTLSLSDAGLKRADEVEWYPGTGGSASPAISGWKAEGRRYCSRLSQLFGIELAGDAFGVGGYQGDGYMGVGGQYGGGVIRMG